ncbi:PST family polysaccharide transporter [Kordia periserrulae]|uniref:PST family polysaccharide transporter n=1 Tax=Kordia periserrulae TaxID=701523 RepID=A0A2T6BYU7_9FLAO|nr:O-antigen translocase [Kordia periserrulae]PTX61147.1 PST family polysaccharide transporter [Kordia periserrulae]
MANNPQFSYTHILKATSLFGGVQVFKILISIIRVKIVAILLGGVGMGIIGLFNSTIQVVSEIAKLGLDTSAVKELAHVHASEDEKAIQQTVSILQKFIMITASIGAVFTIVFSALLSKLTFGNTDYTFEFIWLALAIFFMQLTNGKIAILQGTQALKKLAVANVLGSTVGLLVSIPLYYMYGLEAIVPTIIITAVVIFGFFWYFENTLKIQRISLGIKQAYVEGKSMLRLGLVLSITGIVTLIATYLLQIFIRHVGGLDQVGYYTAGFLIINAYVGMIFNAMGTDYFPRLSAIHTENAKVQLAVRNQATIAILLLTPIITTFFVAAPLVVNILYSKEFLVILGLISWGVLGMAFKAVSWSVGYVILAKGDSRIFVKTSIGFSILMLTMNCVGYYFGGLTGLGISVLAYYIIHFVSLLIITKIAYGLWFQSAFFKLFLLCVLLSGLGFACTYLDNIYLKYGGMIAIMLLSYIFTYSQLQKKMNIKQLIKNKLFKRS